MMAHEATKHVRIVCIEVLVYMEDRRRWKDKIMSNLYELGCY